MNLTLVSGYWQVTNKHQDKYKDWFVNTLSINCPYVFFCNKVTRDIIAKYRKNLPTHYIEMEIEDFYTFKYIKNLSTHPLHCPSKELNLIWNEKIFLINRACQINPFNTEYFAWCDAGICCYRDNPPPSFPLTIKVNLPKDKFIFSSSDSPHHILTNDTTYYHHISGTSYIMHIDLIGKFTNLYKQYIDRYLSLGGWIYTDQVILTIMFNNFPQLFYKLTDGYGEVIRYFFNNI